MPRSSAVVRPSISAPMTTWPFSMRSVLIASVPYGMTPNALARGDDRFPHRATMIGRHVDLVGELARVAHPEHAGGNDAC